MCHRSPFSVLFLGRIIDWNRHSKSKLWTQLEQTQTEVSLKGAVWCFDQLPSALKSHPIIGATLQTGSLIMRTISSLLKTPLFSQYWATQRSPLDLHKQKTLLAAGRDRASHFLEDGRWPSIQSPTSDTGHYRLPFWKAIRLHHFLHSILTFEDYCRDEGALPQVLSKTYFLLNSPPEQPDLSFIQKWELDLQTVLH